jgi:hypothetical protein
MTPGVCNNYQWMKAVFRIRLRIHMFLGLPDPDPLVRSMDPDPSIIKQKSKKNLEFYCFVTSFGHFIFEKLCKCTVPSKSNKQKNFFLNRFWLAF